MFFISLKHWDERKSEEESATGVVNQIYALADSVPDVEMFISTPPIIPGYGMSSGFDLYLQDKAGGDLNDFKKVADDFVEELNKRQEIEMAYSALTRNIPSIGWI